MAGEQSVSDDAVTKAVSIGGRAVAFRVRQRGGVETPSLDVELFAAEPLDDASRETALGRVAAMLSTDEDLSAFYARAREDERFAPLVDRYRGLHHVRFPSPFEAACWGVVNQRIRLAAARNMKEALVRRAGSSITVDGAEHWAFPEPAAVLALSERELERLLPGGRRAAAVRAAASAFLEVAPGFLSRAPIEEVRAWLRGIHGVGPFTSSFVLYRALGRFDGVAMVSPKLLAAAKAQYGRGFTERELADVAASYGPWGGHWMLYLWASSFM